MLDTLYIRLTEYRFQLRQKPNSDLLPHISAEEALIFLDVGFLHYTRKRTNHAEKCYKVSLEHAQTPQGHWRLAELIFLQNTNMDFAIDHLCTAIEKGRSTYIVYLQVSYF